MKKNSLSIALTIIFTAFTQWCMAQKIDPTILDSLVKSEQKLCKIADSMRLSPIPDDRVQYHYQLIKGLRETLILPNAYLYQFDALKERIHIINAPDNTFKLFNWLVANSDWSRTYAGVIQTAKYPQKLIPLIDQSAKMDIKNAQGILNNKRWYGAEYYNMIKDTISGEPAYLLFGYNTNSTNINSKMIDVLRVDAENSEATFGAPIFHGEDQFGKSGVYNRYITYFKKGVSTVLNYDQDKNLIILDKLESDIAAPTRHDTYVPSGRMDGFIKSNGRWIHQKNVVNILKLGDGNAPINGVMKP